MDNRKDWKGRGVPKECPTCGSGESKADTFSLIDGSSWACDICGCLIYD